ncbi:13336_t:CDS:2 [Cetraspora pellucida]|uniref:13336_t:CDS:1 n=1 Tax=Cetraspora pellucida TaxID=1433469 RepID=A0A9N9EIM0_9GLOM|nr:13336_t:CDS:2 [Cetraspora pellucida]
MESDTYVNRIISGMVRLFGLGHTKDFISRRPVTLYLLAKS